MIITFLKFTGLIVGLLAVFWLSTRRESTQRKLVTFTFSIFGLLMLVNGLRAYLTGEEITRVSWTYGAIGWYQDVGIGSLFFLMAIVIYMMEPQMEGEPNKPLQPNASSRPSSGDSPQSENPSSLGPRG
jgi:hypothetical protein